MTLEDIAYEQADGVAHIGLDRQAKLNALTPGMLETLETLIRRVDRDTQVRALVVSGRGRCFSVGADINIWSELSPEQFRTRWIGDGHRVFDAIASCRVPVIAAIHGMAFGGGLELALAADLRIAEPDAVLGLPEASLGTIPGWGGTQRLAELVGRSRAKQMILTAETISAEQAEAWGLVNTICEPGSVIARAQEIAVRIGAQAPIAVQLVKRIIDAGGGETIGATLEMLGGMATQATDDMMEGIAAFRAKRPARFTGV